jgi:hypothetical protein
MLGAADSVLALQIFASVNIWLRNHNFFFGNQAGCQDAADHGFGHLAAADKP